MLHPREGSQAQCCILGRDPRHTAASQGGIPGTNAASQGGIPGTLLHPREGPQAQCCIPGRDPRPNAASQGGTPGSISQAHCCISRRDPRHQCCIPGRDPTLLHPREGSQAQSCIPGRDPRPNAASQGGIPGPMLHPGIPGQCCISKHDGIVICSNVVVVLVCLAATTHPHLP